MRKFLVVFGLMFCLLFSFSFAATIDLSDYDLPDLDTGSTTIYSNQLLTSSNIFIFSSAPLTATNSELYVPSGAYVTYYSYGGSTWSLEEEATNEYGGDGLATFSSITFANYTVYDTEDDSVIIYQPTQEGGESMSQVLTDLTTVMTSVLTNATSLVTWITNNPLVYLWVIMAIIIAIIAFVRGFIRGV